MKKSVIALFLCLVSFWLFAQEAEEISYENEPISQELEPPVSPQPSKSPFFMGLWLETTSNNTFLIRDIATGEQKGFEFNRAAIHTKANWWFWAELTPKFILDGEIGIWEADLPLYQANSFGANIPDTTVTDGFQGLGSVFFAPIFELNGQTVGGFNKLGFNINTPYVNTRFGYGLLKDGGMSEFSGIFNIIDRWDNVGRGYTEFQLGESVSKIGDKIELNTLAGLSRMRAEYGIYSIVGASLFDQVDLTIGFGSTTNAAELFRYNEQNENAVSFYAAANLTDSLKLGVHWLSAFGTEIDGFGTLDTSAIALQVEAEIGPYSLDFIASVAGQEAITVWGDDESIGPDSVSLNLVQWLNIKDFISVGLDTGISNSSINDLFAGDFNAGFFNIRNQPMVDLEINNITLSLYGVMQLDRITFEDDESQPWAFWFEEAGIGVTLNELPFMKKLSLDYAMLLDYNEWDNGYDLNMLYNSIMINGDINDAFSANIGSIIRAMGYHNSILGFAVGASIKTGWKFGAPRLWTHITYGMDPYEDNGYSLFRADDPVNRPGNRTFLLNRLNDSVDICRFSIGLIWEL